MSRRIEVRTSRHLKRYEACYIDEWVIVTHQGDVVEEGAWKNGSIELEANSARVPPHILRTLEGKIRAELATITARTAADFIEELRREAASGAAAGPVVQTYLNAKLIEFGIPLLSECQGEAHLPLGTAGHDNRGPDYCSICGREGRWGFVGNEIRVRK